MTDRYAVYGHPIAHSKSPQIHTAFARQTGQDMTYEAILAPLDGFAESVAAFIAAGGRGANVTVPFKEEAFKLANRLPPRAPRGGAADTLAYDMMYGRDTPFLGFARTHGARTADGLGMLVEQAAEAFCLWRGVRPNTAPVIAALHTA